MAETICKKVHDSADVGAVVVVTLLWKVAESSNQAYSLGA